MGGGCKVGELKNVSGSDAAPAGGWAGRLMADRSECGLIDCPGSHNVEPNSCQGKCCSCKIATPPSKEQRDTAGRDPFDTQAISYATPVGDAGRQDPGNPDKEILTLALLLHPPVHCVLRLHIPPSLCPRRYPCLMPHGCDAAFKFTAPFQMTLPTTICISTTPVPYGPPASTPLPMTTICPPRPILCATPSQLLLSAYCIQPRAHNQSLLFRCAVYKRSSWPLFLPLPGCPLSLPPAPPALNQTCRPPLPTHCICLPSNSMSYQSSSPPLPCHSKPVLPSSSVPHPLP